MNTAGTKVSVLCSEDGISYKQEFKAYLDAREKYEAAFIAFGKWQKEDPGGEVPIEIESALARTMPLWNLLYNHAAIDAQIGAITELSASCPLP
jgi:hypothetical protein